MNVITALAEAGVCRYILCDHDTPDVTNLNRQFIYTAGDPRPKSVISAEWILALNPAADVEAVSEPVTPENGDMFAGCDVIVDCLDSFEARMALDDHSQRMGIPLVHAGVSGLHGQLYVSVPGRTPGLRDVLGTARDPEGNRQGPGGPGPLRGCRRHDRGGHGGPGGNQAHLRTGILLRRGPDNN